MKKTSLLIIAALAAASAFALPRKAAEITVSGYTGKSILENFPVLVRISPERISGFSYADCAAGGADIAFHDAQGNVQLRSKKKQVEMSYMLMQFLDNAEGMSYSIN